MIEIAPLQKWRLHPLVMGLGQLRSIETQGLLLLSLRNTKFLLPSLSLWKQTYFQIFDSISIERAIAPPSEGSGSILNHSNIRSNIRQDSHYCHKGAQNFCCSL